MSSPDNYAKFISIQEKTNTSLLRSDPLLEYKGVDKNYRVRGYSAGVGGAIGGVLGAVGGAVAGGNPMTAWMGSAAGSVGGIGLAGGIAHAGVKLLGDHLERKRQKKANAAIDALAEKHGMTVKKRAGNVNHLVGGVLGKGEHIAFHVPTGEEVIPEHTWTHSVKKTVISKRGGNHVINKTINHHGEHDLHDTIDHLDDYLTSLHEAKPLHEMDQETYTKAIIGGGLAGAAGGAYLSGLAGAGLGFVGGAVGGPALVGLGLGAAHLAGYVGEKLSAKRENKRDKQRYLEDQARGNRKAWDAHTKNLSNALENLRTTHGIQYKEGKEQHTHVISGGPLKAGHTIVLRGEHNMALPPTKYKFTHYVTEKTRKGVSTRTHLESTNGGLNGTYHKLDNYLSSIVKQREGARKNRESYEARMKELEANLQEETVNKYADYFSIQNKLDVGLLRNK